MDTQEPPDDQPAGQSRERLSLGSDQAYGSEGAPGVGAWWRVCHEPARPDLDQVHRQSAALRPARPEDRREAGSVRLPHRPDRYIREALTEKTFAALTPREVYG